VLFVYVWPSQSLCHLLTFSRGIFSFSLWLVLPLVALAYPYPHPMTTVAATGDLLALTHSLKYGPVESNAYQIKPSLRCAWCKSTSWPSQGLRGSLSFEALPQWQALYGVLSLWPCATLHSGFQALQHCFDNECTAFNVIRYGMAKDFWVE
jgi:hypothetical protein